MAAIIDHATLRPKASREMIQREFWKRKCLKFILRPHQWPLYDMFHRGGNQCWNVSRQFGKSTSLTCLGTEFCLRNPGAFVRFYAPTRAQARDIVEQNMPVILESAPREFLPTYMRNQSKYVFPNGATITLRGTDAAGGKGLRGGSAHLVVLDEAAFMSDLEWIVSSVVMPMFQNTDGRYIMSSTPPATTSHPWAAHFVEDHIRRNSYITLNFDDNTGLSAERKEAIMLENSIVGPDGQILEHARERDPFKREYLCQIINDSTFLIIPEFQAVKHVVVAEHKRPNYFVPVVAADWGLKDYDAILYGYIDFAENKLIIEEETLVNYSAPSDTAELIKKKVAELWPNTPLNKIRFFGDTDLARFYEIRKQTGINFRPSHKYDLEAALASVRTKMSMTGVRIHPRCQNLIRQLDQGVWEMSGSGQRKQFKRSADLGHCDLISALVYLNRMSPWGENPTPPAPPVSEVNHHVPASVSAQPKHAMQGIFGRRRL